MKLFWDAIKEPLREILLAALPGVLAYLGTLNAQWAITLYLVLRFIDSWLHEKGKIDSTPKVDSPLLIGLTRF